MITLKEERYYQPVPFNEYKLIESWREDSPQRYKDIFDSIPKCNTLIDICCSNGYFLFKFINDGGRQAIGVEINDACVDFINELALQNNLNASCVKDIKLISPFSVDVGIYLDTYDFDSQNKFEYISILKNSCKYSFISTCQGDRNYELRDILCHEFNSVEEVHKGYQGRAIYKCMGVNT